MKNGIILLAVSLVLGTVFWLALPFFADQGTAAREGPARVRMPVRNSGARRDLSAAILAAGEQNRRPEIVQALAVIDTILRLPASGETSAALLSPVAVLLDNGKDGLAALQDLLGQTQPGAGRAALLAVFADAWATRDPEEAVVWAARRPDAVERGTLVGRICFAIAERDPQRAMELVLPLQFDGRTETISTIVERWFSRDPAEVSNWTLQLPDGEVRTRLLSRLAVLDARRSPEEAARFVLQNLPEGDALDEAVSVVVRNWITQDAESATRWAQALPQGSLRERALRELAGGSVVPVATDDGAAR